MKFFKKSRKFIILLCYLDFLERFLVLAIW